MIKEIIENAREVMVSYSYNRCYSQKQFDDPDICESERESTDILTGVAN